MNRSLRLGGGVLVAATYAWFATGVRPFGSGAYTYVALPSLVALGFLIDTEVRRRASPNRNVTRSLPIANAAPWLAVLAAAVALEAVGLALGGRSTSVPTLSTTVDHLLVTHAVRWLLFVAWLAVGEWGLRSSRVA